MTIYVYIPTTIIRYFYYYTHTYMTGLNDNTVAEYYLYLLQRNKIPEFRFQGIIRTQFWFNPEFYAHAMSVLTILILLNLIIS